MSETQAIETCLKRAARWRRWNRFWRGIWMGLCAGAVLWLVALGLFKLFPIPETLVFWTGAISMTFVVAGGIVGAWGKSSLQDTARWLDERSSLKQRLSTAWELEGNRRDDDWHRLVLNDAARAAEGVDPGKLLPLRLPRTSRWALLALALGAGLGFVPEYRTEAFRQLQEERANIKDTGKHLAEFTRQQLIERPPALAPTEKTLESVRELGDELSRVRLTRSDALKKLASAVERVQRQSDQLTQDPALKRMKQAARTPSGQTGNADLEKRIDALQKALGQQNSDPDTLDRLRKELENLKAAAAGNRDNNGALGQEARNQLARAMAEFQKNAEDAGVALPSLEEAIAALKGGFTDRFLKDLDIAANDLEKLQDLAKKMAELQAQSEKTGKDLAEQLENGQAEAAQATLQRMAREMRQSDLSEESRNQLQQEIEKAIKPGEMYGEVARHLKDAAQKAKQGDQNGAAESLAKAAEELEKLRQQLADAEAILANLEALQRAQMCIGNCQGWGQKKGLPRFGPGGKPGSGVGTWADESDWGAIPERTAGWDNSGIQRPDMDERGLTERSEDRAEGMLPTKVRGKLTPGGPMPSITLKGLSIKGDSRVSYEEAVSAAQVEAQSALNQEKVPRAYQQSVRQYFNDLPE